ncbi:flagellar export chaperone FliS [Cohnella caldifontis]|uniref:flagellar export chaperone FliS n=1 Tax=Cohnella caldifontis TaxID=3027471 RepID=UPI003BB703C1
MNLQQPGYQAYQKNKYETASPHRLILMLYDGALSNLNRARIALNGNQRQEAHRYIQKTQDILFELLACLNEEQGGVIAQNLKELYFYMIKQLVQANIQKKADLLDESESILRQLRGAWEQIGKEISHGAV